MGVDDECDHGAGEHGLRSDGRREAGLTGLPPRREAAPLLSACLCMRTGNVSALESVENVG
jgi:hypothetical protein